MTFSVLIIAVLRFRVKAAELAVEPVGQPADGSVVHALPPVR
jgi:hypothetical protein